MNPHTHELPGPPRTDGSAANVPSTTALGQIHMGKLNAPALALKGISGARTKRPALPRCLKTLHPGDTFIAWKMNRLGRSLRDLIRMLDGCASTELRSCLAKS